MTDQWIRNYQGIGALFSTSMEMLKILKEVEKYLHSYHASPDSREGRDSTILMNRIRVIIDKAEGKN